MGGVSLPKEKFNPLIPGIIGLSNEDRLPVLSEIEKLFHLNIQILNVPDRIHAVLTFALL